MLTRVPIHKTASPRAVGVFYSRTLLFDDDVRCLRVVETCHALTLKPRLADTAANTTEHVPNVMCSDSASVVTCRKYSCQGPGPLGRGETEGSHSSMGIARALIGIEVGETPLPCVK